MTGSKSLDVLIVGAGFGGLAQLYSLRNLDYSCEVIESGAQLGGQVIQITGLYTLD